MKWQNLILCIVFFSLIFVSCNTNDKSKQKYLADIGDTIFNPSLDDAKFKFCDSSNVLHKRAYVKYTGGTKILENDIISQYKIKPEYRTFNGYFIVRFAVNCNDETGRFRWEVVNADFEETTPPKGLEKHIIDILKGLNKWNHPFYNKKDYDGYTYIIVKIENGNIVRS